jgi:hypothetical protein
VTHDHPSARAGARHFPALLTVFAMVVVFMVIEVIAGFATGSLALLSDAGHMATDALGLGMALAAITAANRAGSTGSRSSPRWPTRSSSSVLPATSSSKPSTAGTTPPTCWQARC